MRVYESNQSKNRNPSDLNRFNNALGKMKNSKVTVERVECWSVSDIERQDVAYGIVSKKGMDSLPIVICNDEIISEGNYPDDKHLCTIFGSK